MRQGVMQHGMAQMNPRVRMRWGPPQELSLDFLDGMLRQVGQHKSQFVRHRGSGTMVIRTVTPACTGLPIDGAVPHIGPSRVLERGQQRRAFRLRSSRHRPSTPGPLGDILVAWHRHLRHAILGREA
jgi:hypothetical protein